MANGNGGGQPQEYQSPEITELGRVQDLSLEATGTICTYEGGGELTFCGNSSSGKTAGVTTQATCDWTAEGSDDWIHVTPSSGTGPGSVTVTVDSYLPPGDTRTGSVTIQGSVGTPVIYTITQYTSPVAVIAVTCTPGVYHFNAGGSTPSSDGTITNYLWNFGDSTTGAGVTYAKTYGRQPKYPAKFTVQLTITDSNGCSAVTTREIVVPPPTGCPT